jgi:hypothetical protein
MIKFALPAALLGLIPAGCGSAGGSGFQPAIPAASVSSASRATQSGGSATGGGATAKPGGTGGGSASSGSRVVGRIESQSSSNPIGYYSVQDLYVVNGQTYQMAGFAKIDVANGPAQVGACVTLTTTVVKDSTYFTKLVTELPSVCP